MNKKDARREKVQEYIESTIEGYLNGCYDDDYPPMTKDQYIDYVIESLRMDAESGIRVNGDEFKNLYFYGIERIKKMIADYIDTYEGIKPWLI